MKSPSLQNPRRRADLRKLTPITFSPYLHQTLSMPAELTGQVAVVTGAARGIGEAIGKQLASMGATVVLAARDTAQLQRVQQDIERTGGAAQAVQLDLLEEASV